MSGMAAAGGEWERSCYLRKEEIERGSPSKTDGVGAALEAQTSATYCSFLRDIGLRLQLPQITITVAIVLYYRFYLYRSHAKNEWKQMYKKNANAARRIIEKEPLDKRNALILVGEALLLSIIRYDFNIQCSYETLKVALKNLAMSQNKL